MTTLLSFLPLQTRARARAREEEVSELYEAEAALGGSITTRVLLRMRISNCTARTARLRSRNRAAISGKYRRRLVPRPSPTILPRCVNRSLLPAPPLRARWIVIKKNKRHANAKAQTRAVRFYAPCPIVIVLLLRYSIVYHFYVCAGARIYSFLGSNDGRYNRLGSGYRLSNKIVSFTFHNCCIFIFRPLSLSFSSLCLV